MNTLTINLLTKLHLYYNKETEKNITCICFITKIKKRVNFVTKNNKKLVYVSSEQTLISLYIPQLYNSIFLVFNN